MDNDTDLPLPRPEPPVDTPLWESLHPRAFLGMCAATLIGFVLPYVPVATIALTAWDSAGLSAMSKLLVFCAGLIAVAIGAWRLARARFARTAFALDAAGLRIRRGVFWRSETLVPRSRVQHTDLNRGPLDRHFGLATLKVYTAGTKFASVALDGLPDARAMELRDALLSEDDDAL